MNNKLKLLRVENSLTQEMLAKDLDVNIATIKNAEKGLPISGDVVLKLGDYFDEDPRDIFFNGFVVRRTTIVEKNSKFKEGVK